MSRWVLALPTESWGVFLFMKVYFELGGCGGNKVFIRVYVKPTKDGHGYYYNAEGNLSKFAWTTPKNALCIDHKSMPKELWYAFRYGEWHWQMDDKYDFTIENVLKYAESPKRTIEQVKAERKLKNVVLNTEQDIVDVLHLIDQCKYCPNNIANRIFEIANMNKATIVNGEIGIASLYDTINLCAYLDFLRGKFAN